MPWASVAIIAVAAANGPVIIEIAPEAPCVLATALPAALRDEGIEVGPQAGFRLAVLSSPDALSLELTDARGAKRGSRRLPFVTDDCSDAGPARRPRDLPALALRRPAAHGEYGTWSNCSRTALTPCCTSRGTATVHTLPCAFATSVYAPAGTSRNR
jgi:hypothetical protein